MKKDIGSIQRELAKPGSALAKYKNAVAGDCGYLRLCYLEGVVLIADSIVGSLGVLLRRILYRPLFATLDTGVILGRNFSFRRPHLIELHANSRLGDRVVCNVKREPGKIVLARNTKIGNDTILSCAGGLLEIGENSEIGDYCRLGSLMGLRIGRNCRIGEKSYIVGAGHATDALDVPIINQPIVCKGPNDIGDDVAIGNCVTILDGITIGSGAIVESGSLVTLDVPAKTRVAGVPASVCPEGTGS